MTGLSGLAGRVPAEPVPSSSSIRPPVCFHEWERASDRDVTYGHPVRMQSLVFWCRKCLKIETREIVREEDAE